MQESTEVGHESNLQGDIPISIIFFSGEELIFLWCAIPHSRFRDHSIGIFYLCFGKVRSFHPLLKAVMDIFPRFGLF